MGKCLETGGRKTHLVESIQRLTIDFPASNLKLESSQKNVGSVRGRVKSNYTKKI